MLMYLDTSYIAKCYLNEPGSPRVLEWLAGKSGLSCCSHGRLELFAALKRHEREGNLCADALRAVFERLGRDEQRGLWRWIPVTDELVRVACARVRTVSGGAFVRAADALHLTCAADNGFDAVYSHDQRMLNAADCFGLEGRDILA